MYRIKKLKSRGNPLPEPIDMKDRILKIMKQENLNQKDFAATTGISPATLSSIFNGRTSPTLNHAEALHRRFPQLSMSWLMFGEGDMYVPDAAGEKKRSSVDAAGSGDLFGGGLGNETPSASVPDSPTRQSDVEEVPLHAHVVREVVKYIDKPKRKITEVRIFFDDGTFETFLGPGH